MVALQILAGWPAAGFVDTEIRCLTELESGKRWLAPARS